MIETAKVFFAATMMTMAFIMLQTKEPVHNALIYIFLCAYGAFFLCLYYGEKHKHDKIDDTWRDRMATVYEDLDRCRRNLDYMEHNSRPITPEPPIFLGRPGQTNPPEMSTELQGSTQDRERLDELIAELDKRYITLAQADKRYQKVSKLERILTPTKENQMEE